MSKLSKVLGGRKGPDNPYGPADWKSLLDSSKFDYLKDYAGKAFAPVKAQSEGLFQDYLKGIKSGYSTEDEQLQNLLRDIGRETENNVGSAKLDYADRGLGGPGQGSDIEAIGLAQTRGRGQELGDEARLGVLSGREKQMADAYNQRYLTGTNLGSLEASAGIDLNKYLADLISGRQTASVSGQAGSYQAGQDAKNKYSTPSFWDTLTQHFGASLGKKAGEQTGSWVPGR